MILCAITPMQSISTTLFALRPMLVPVASGLATHFLYKKREIPLSSLLITIMLLVVAPVASSAFLFLFYSVQFSLLSGCAAFYGALLSSICVYRLSPWHPLSKYPGPLPARISQLWLARETARGKWHETLRDLHAQYGPYVRIGPNQLSFVDAALIPKILGPDGMPKGPMFDGARMPGVPENVVATRDLADHAQKRKPWSKGLSSASLKEYAPTIARRAVQLAEELDEYAAKSSDASEARVAVDFAVWMSRFAFDFMGDMAFGGGFELMSEGDTAGIWGMIDQQMKAMAILERLPWTSDFVHKLPLAVEVMAKFTKFVDNCVLQRFARGPRGKDLFYHLANEEGGPNAHTPHALLIEDCKVAIVAGSDTTATTLCNMFYYLLTNQSVLTRLRAELDEAFPPGEGDPFDLVRLSELPILNAVINETLRLQPPVPTDLQRAPAAGSGCKQIGEHVILEGTSVNVPPYVLHRQARYFSPMPETFWIDRWLQPPPDAVEKLSPGAIPFIHDTSAYIPFSYGPANCAGKMLALAEVRSVAALLLQRFDVQFKPGYDPARWEKDLRSHFVLRPGSLPVILTKRNRV